MTGCCSGSQRRQDGEAVEVGHLDVEEHQVGRLGANHVDGFAAVARLPGDFDVRLAPEQLREPPPGGLLVVDDEGADTVHRHRSRLCYFYCVPRPK